MACCAAVWLAACVVLTLGAFDGRFKRTIITRASPVVWVAVHRTHDDGDPTVCFAVPADAAPLDRRAHMEADVGPTDGWTQMTAFTVGRKR